MRSLLAIGVRPFRYHRSKQTNFFRGPSALCPIPLVKAEAEGMDVLAARCGPWGGLGVAMAFGETYCSP